VTNDQFMVMDGKVTHVPGGVDEFLRKLDEHDRAAAATAQAQAAEKPAPSAQAAAGTGGLSRSDEYRLRKQLASVERKIEAQRKRVEETQAAMLQVAASDFVELGRLQEKVDAAQAAIDELELEWLELSEQLGE
jgi:ATPase subunit of ABC transporter with duplicated ATPase domains